MNPSRKRPGLLFTLVGPAGVGKNRLMRDVLGRTPLKQLATATTRAMRVGEEEGREHQFVSTETFEHMIEADELLEHEHIHGHLYGMPRAAVEARLNSGASIIADIGVQGAARARAAFPENVVVIFIQPPTIGSLIERMGERRESEAEIGKRLLRVPKELDYAPKCHYLILNDSFERAADKLYEIVTAELNGTSPKPRGDDLQTYRFVYYVEVVPVYHEEMLRRDGAPAGLATPFNPVTELPAQVAVRFLRTELHCDSAPINNDKRIGDYVPPITLKYTRDENGERFTYIYFQRLDVRIEAPAGWSWLPVESLPETLRSVVLESDHESA